MIVIIIGCKFLMWHFKCEFLFISTVMILVFFIVSWYKVRIFNLSIFAFITKRTFIYQKSKTNWGCYFDSIECILTVRFMGAAPAEASSLVRTSSSGNCCSWQFKAVIRNASLGSFETSSY